MEAAAARPGTLATGPGPAERKAVKVPTRVQALPSAEPRAGSPLRQSRVAVPTGQSPPDEDGRECMWRWRVATSPQEDAFGRLLPCILPACCARAIAVAVGPGTPASVSSVHRAVWITCLAAAATLRDMGAQGWPAPLHRMHRPRGSRAHLHFDPLSSAPLGTTRVRVCNSFHPPLSSPPARDAEDPRHQGGGSRSTAVAIPGKDKPSAPLDVSLGASTIVVGSAGPSSSLGTQPCASPPGPRDWQPSSSHVALWGGEDVVGDSQASSQRHAREAVERGDLWEGFESPPGRPSACEVSDEAWRMSGVEADGADGGTRWSPARRSAGTPGARSWERERRRGTAAAVGAVTMARGAGGGVTVVTFVREGQNEGRESAGARDGDGFGVACNDEAWAEEEAGDGVGQRVPGSVPGRSRHVASETRLEETSLAESSTSMSKRRKDGVQVAVRVRVGVRAAGGATDGDPPEGQLRPMAAHPVPELGVTVPARKGPRRLLSRDDLRIRAFAGDDNAARVALTRDDARRPMVFMDRLTITAPSFEEIQLGQDARRVLQEPNAGGNSVRSEVLSMEYLATKFRARDVVTEMEVEYWSSSWKRVDFTCTVWGNTRVGVSVTRAMGFPSAQHFTEVQAHRLLAKKLHGLVVARVGCSSHHWFWGSLAHVTDARQSYTKSILHVLCQTESIAATMARVCPRVCRELGVQGVVILLTVVEASDSALQQIFLEKRIGCHDGLSDGCDGEKHGSHDGERSLAPFGAASGSGIPHGLPSAHASPEDGGDGPDDEDVGLCNLMVGFATADEEC